MDTLKKKTLQVFEIGLASVTDLKRTLNDYSGENNAGNKSFMQGHTFDSGLAFLNQVEKLIYNEQNRNLIQGAPENFPELQNIFTKIDENNKHLFEIETSLNVFFKNVN